MSEHFLDKAILEAELIQRFDAYRLADPKPPLRLCRCRFSGVYLGGIAVVFAPDEEYAKALLARELQKHPGCDWQSVHVESSEAVPDWPAALVLWDGDY